MDKIDDEIDFEFKDLVKSFNRTSTSSNSLFSLNDIVKVSFIMNRKIYTFSEYLFEREQSLDDYSVTKDTPYIHISDLSQALPVKLTPFVIQKILDFMDSDYLFELEQSLDDYSDIKDTSYIPISALSQDLPIKLTPFVIQNLIDFIDTIPEGSLYINSVPALDFKLSLKSMLK